MDSIRAEAMRKELRQLLHKQAEVLQSRTLGVSTDTDILEYEIRQEIIQEVCNQLANSDVKAISTHTVTPRRQALRDGIF